MRNYEAVTDVTELDLSAVRRNRMGLYSVAVLDGETVVATRTGLTPRMARRRGARALLRLARRVEKAEQKERMRRFDKQFNGWIMDDPSRLNLSQVYTSRIGLPYVFVLYGDTTVTARLGLTSGMACALGDLRIRRLTQQSERQRSTRSVGILHP